MVVIQINNIIYYSNIIFLVVNRTLQIYSKTFFPLTTKIEQFLLRSDRTSQTRMYM